MEETKFTRRKARAAMEVAFKYAGIPPDYIVLPHQDDTEQLLVVSDHEVRWLGDCQTYRRAEVFFDTAVSGAVVGTNMLALSASKAFWPEDYGINRPYRFELPFDITDEQRQNQTAWENLPMAKIRKRPKPYQPKVRGSFRD